MEYNVINMEKAQELLDKGMDKAKELLKNKGEVSKLLDEVQQKIQETPLLGQAVADLPTLIDMVKSYVTKEYDVVSPKVIATGVSAFLYLVTKKDLVKDNIPVLGLLDDIAVIVLAINFIGPELKAYTEWKTAQQPEETTEEA